LGFFRLRAFPDEFLDSTSLGREGEARQEQEVEISGTEVILAIQIQFCFLFGNTIRDHSYACLALIILDFLFG